MKFRQRIAWVVLFSYLTLSFVTIYYFFELADQYNILALDHTKLYHSSQSDGSDGMWTLWKHLPDVPYIVWMLTATSFYLQIFCLIYACTKPEPKKYLLSYIMKLCNVFGISRCTEKHKKHNEDSNGNFKLNQTMPPNGHIKSLILQAWQFFYNVWSQTALCSKVDTLFNIKSPHKFFLWMS